MHRIKTLSLKKDQIKKKWVLIDATDAVLGRLAVVSANILRGKNKPHYTPNQDCGDNLIIINSDKTSYKDPSITMSINEGPPDERALFTAPDISRGSVTLSACRPMPFAISEISNGVSKFE